MIWYIYLELKTLKVNTGKSARTKTVIRRVVSAGISIYLGWRSTERGEEMKGKEIEEDEKAIVFCVSLYSAVII